MTCPDATTLAAQLRHAVIDPIDRALVGKTAIIELMGVALVAGENLFLLGPPGTGKSALVNCLASRLSGRSFEYLLTRFTEPAELFGPFDLRRLREGDLVTNTDGMLPEADFVFLDELFNANSAILNSLLTALNERIYRRGRDNVRLPMLLAVGASNRLPDDETLAALLDRFLLRVTCDNVPDESLGSVLTAGWATGLTSGEKINSPEPLSIDVVRQMMRLVDDVDLKPIREVYVGLVGSLRAAGLPISDRRAVRLQRVIAASAVVAGRATTRPSDLWVLRNIWDTPAQFDVIAAQVDEAITAAGSDDSANGDDHPMSGADCIDPQRLADAIASITAEDPAAGDRLTLLSARTQWVTPDAAREDLSERIAQARQRILPRGGSC